MRRALIAFAFLCLACSQTARAEIIFEVSLRNPGTIRVGEIVVFDISLRSSPNDISNLGGATFFLGAHDPAANGGVTVGGVFRSGTNDSASPLAGGRNYLFSSGEGGFFNADDSFVVFSAAGANRSLTTGGGFLGSVQLDASGAAPGTYAMTFSSLDAIDALGNTLPGPFSGPTMLYTIVPEPSSIMILAALAFGATTIRRRRS